MGNIPLEGKSVIKKKIKPKNIFLFILKLNTEAIIKRYTIAVEYKTISGITL